MDWIIHNGKLMPQQEAMIPVTNRAFLYGDSLFESIRMVNGKYPFLSDHIERLEQGMELLGLDLPHDINSENLQDQLNRLANTARLGENARFRITVYREGGGRYTPESSASGYLVVGSALEAKEFELNEEGITIGMYKDGRKPMIPLSNFKTGSALLYVLAGKYFWENEWEDGILLNAEGRVADALSSTVFAVKGAAIYTPSLKEGAVAGVMRKNIIKLAEKHKMVCKEQTITPEFLMSAEEIWLTNAINGIRWVKSFEGRNYAQKFAGLMTAYLNASLKQ